MTLSLPKNKIVSARLYPAKNQLKIATVFSLPTDALPLIIMMESKSVKCFYEINK